MKETRPRAPRTTETPGPGRWKPHKRPDVLFAWWCERCGKSGSTHTQHEIDRGLELLGMTHYCIEPTSRKGAFLKPTHVLTLLVGATRR